MSAPRPHPLSPRQMRFRLNLYPPFLFARIRITEIEPGFQACTLRIRPSLLTRNLQGTLFGGTIYSAADPIFALLYWQALAHRGLRVQAWTKTVTIRFMKPARSLTLRFEITDDDIAAATAAVERDGRYAKSHTVCALDAAGETCAEIENGVVLRRPRSKSKDRPAF